GPRPDDGDRVARLDPRDGRPVVAGREDVPHEQRSLIFQVFRHGQQVHVRVRDAHQFGLGPTEATAEGTGPQIAELIAQRRLPAPAEPAMSAHDVERDHDAVTGPEPLDAGTRPFHDPHAFMADRVAGGQGSLPRVEVEVRTADRGAGNPNDGVPGVLYGRLGNVRN